MKVKSRFGRVSIDIFFNTLKTFMNDLLVLFEEFHEDRLNTREGQEKHTRERARAHARACACLGEQKIVYYYLTLITLCSSGLANEVFPLLSF